MKTEKAQSLALTKALHRVLLQTLHRIKTKKLFRKKEKNTALYKNKITEQGGLNKKPKSVKAKEQQLDVNACNI